jgi:hypothetical protein
MRVLKLCFAIIGNVVPTTSNNFKEVARLQYWSVLLQQFGHVPPQHFRYVFHCFSIDYQAKISWTCILATYSLGSPNMPIVALIALHVGNLRPPKP